jgi:hypothetical protein
MKTPTLFSRALVGGKKIEKLEARVSYELKEAVRRKWLDAGFCSESEYLETLVSCDVFGSEHVRMLADQRIASVLRRV